MNLHTSCDVCETTGVTLSKTAYGDLCATCIDLIFLLSSFYRLSLRDGMSSPEKYAAMGRLVWRAVQMAKEREAKT